MGKKKKHEEHENLERWLVSYADFMTLLFATFVVLYALAQLDLAKAKVAEDSIRKAFSPANILQGDNGIMDKAGESILETGSAPTDNINLITPMMEAEEAKQEDALFKDAINQIKEMTKEGSIDGINTKIHERGLEITLVDSLFFTSGSADIKTSAYSSLNKIGRIIKRDFYDHPIRVEGHTDNLPIKSYQFPSNWELSSARAANVVRYMIREFSMPSNRFAAIGYADNKPLATNITENGRRKNRRVEIIILRNRLAHAEPKIPGINKLRVEKIKQLKEEGYTGHTITHNTPVRTDNKHIENEAAHQNNLSDATKKLLEGTGKSIHKIILYGDSYDQQSAEIARKLKQKEKSIKTSKSYLDPSPSIEGNQAVPVQEMAITKTPLQEVTKKSTENAHPTHH